MGVFPSLQSQCCTHGCKKTWVGFKDVGGDILLIQIYIYIYTHAYTHIYGYIGIRPSHEKDPCDFTSMIMACNQVPDGFAHGLGEQARMLVQQGNQSCSGYLERCFWMIQPPKKLVRVSFMMIFSNMLGSSNIISPVILKHHLTKENRFL